MHFRKLKPISRTEKSQPRMPGLAVKTAGRDQLTKVFNLTPQVSEPTYQVFLTFRLSNQRIGWRPLDQFVGKAIVEKHFTTARKHLFVSIFIIGSTDPYLVKEKSGFPDQVHIDLPQRPATGNGSGRQLSETVPVQCLGPDSYCIVKIFDYHLIASKMYHIILNANLANILFLSGGC